MHSIRMAGNLGIMGQVANPYLHGKLLLKYVCVWLIEINRVHE